MRPMAIRILSRARRQAPVMLIRGLGKSLLMGPNLRLPPNQGGTQHSKNIRKTFATFAKRGDVAPTLLSEAAHVAPAECRA